MADESTALVPLQERTGPVMEAATWGAYEIMHRPLRKERLARILEEFHELRREMTGVVPISKDVLAPAATCVIIGRSSLVMSLCEKVARIAQVEVPVLITGETGTGKELVARALHKVGPRRERRFVTVNCSAVVETLFESELFGHVRGAFTGAVQNRAGAFEERFVFGDIAEQQTHHLSERNKGLDKMVELITVSVDTPFAQKRFAEQAKIANVTFTVTKLLSGNGAYTQVKFVPHDTDTFNALVESAALDIHAYIIQCNNRQYGDSRIRAPYKDRWKRDLLRVMERHKAMPAGALTQGTVPVAFGLLTEDGFPHAGRLDHTDGRGRCDF